MFLFNGFLLLAALPASWIAAISSSVLPIFLRWLGPANIYQLSIMDRHPYPTMTVLSMFALASVLGGVFQLSLSSASLGRPLLRRLDWYRRIELRELSDMGRSLYRSGYAPDDLETALFKYVPCCDSVQELRPGYALCYPGDQK